jgi:hypothetical protein
VLQTLNEQRRYRHKPSIAYQISMDKFVRKNAEMYLQQQSRSPSWPCCNGIARPQGTVARSRHATLPPRSPSPLGGVSEWQDTASCSPASTYRVALPEGEKGMTTIEPWQQRVAACQAQSNKAKATLRVIGTDSGSPAPPSVKPTRTERTTLNSSV